MSRSKTIQIFLKDADPEGIKIAELSNSIAKIFVIPRDQLRFAKTRPELNQPAFYLLFDDERTSVYIGECENFANRVKDHEVKKSFWKWAVICTTNGSSLNKAHVKFLESYSIQIAIEIGRYQIQNRNSPIENNLHEFDQAFVMDYFQDIELLLSSLGFNIFEELREETQAEIVYDKKSELSESQRDFDTIVAPCSKDGFEKAFVNKGAWWAVRIGQAAIPKLKYVSLYESAPIKAIRAYAKISRIEPFPQAPGKYIIYHDGNIKYFDNPVVLGTNSNLSLQGSRYYLLENISASKTLGELTDMTYGTKFTD